MRTRIEQLGQIPEQENKEYISSGITEHSKRLDKEISENPAYTEQEIRESFKIEEWKIGDTQISAIGVSHIPETFLQFRKQIEGEIEESDVVVNEFAPEAFGIYDSVMSEKLKEIPSKFNGDYNLEELRQIFLKHEREWNLGTFHHEIELLSAKYGKEMAVIDMSYFNMNTEVFLQSNYIYSRTAEQIDERIAILKRSGLYGGSLALALIGLRNFLKEFKRPISRRSFLKAGLLGTAGIIAGSTPKLTQTPPQRTMVKLAEEMNNSNGVLRERLRNLKLADSLRVLSLLGYRKIAFIYGIAHLKYVKEYLDNPEKMDDELKKYEKEIAEINPDSFKIYELVPGQNHSERFVASKNMVWQRKK